MNRFVSVCGMVLALGVGLEAVSRTESRAGQSDPAPGGVLQSRVPRRTGILLAAGDREGASRFLRPEDRPYFLEHPEPPFQDPEVQGIEASADGTRAVARIAFNLLTPAGPFRWKIRQAWTCVGGEWVAEPRRSTGNPFQSRPAAVGADRRPPIRGAAPDGPAATTKDTPMTHIQRWTSVLLAVTVHRQWRYSLGAGDVHVCRARRRPSSGPDMPSRWDCTVVLGHLRDHGGRDAIPIDLSPAVLTGDADAIVISINGVQATGFSAMVDPDCRASPVACAWPVWGPGRLVRP